MYKALSVPLYRLLAKQSVPISRTIAWNFLSNPKNLERITPKKMKFNILAGGSSPVYTGQTIHYKVSPLPGYTTRWISEIGAVEKEHYFMDRQLIGPYALWHHQHFIKELNGGVLLEDIVDYKLPLGFLGRLAQQLLVRKELTQVFSYRAEQLERLFGSIPEHPAYFNVQSI